MIMPATAQTKINGIVMPNVMKVNGKYLKLNGGGVREKMFLDLYVGALYLESKTSDANKIINDDKPMAIKLRIISGMVNKDNMEEAIREGFEKSTKNKTEALKTRINQLINKGFSSEIVKGDVFDITYEPGIGVKLLKNNKLLTTIKGLDFKKALFGIWLCDKPADASLKAKMLGK
ncbi:MAG TPA: chalcone isomerase [Crocinitomix sp.]|nr:chalcone isomerase [Crocinitomix sp.]